MLGLNITTEIENNAAIIAINSIHFQVRATNSVRSNSNV